MPILGAARAVAARAGRSVFTRLMRIFSEFGYRLRDKSMDSGMDPCQ